MFLFRLKLGSKLYGMRNKRFYFLQIIMLLAPCTAIAQWATITSTDAEILSSGPIAYSENIGDYRLEIFKDSENLIKSRFILKKGLLGLSASLCPTYQIDSGTARNNSTDNSPCIFDSGSAEYIIGKVVNNQVKSSVLVALMEGLTLSFRFKLKNGDYRETSFSLAGSKRSLTAVIGEQVSVSET